MRTDEFEYTVAPTYVVSGVVFTKTSSWEGLEKWEDANGRVMIVQQSHANPGFGKAFEDMAAMEGKPRKMRLIKCTPDLVPEIVALKSQAPISAERHGLQQIREAVYNDHPTCVWMQKVAAHALEPLKFPHPGKQSK